ncbi:MAG: alpha/beta hydrolase [Bacteroidia bacterium]|nr:MAG: alpha/beta hydrolase [Bacteroidia bacterium]
MQLLILVMPGIVTGQQRTGNIVEIFDRDTVETTREGSVLHTFTEGMALRDAMRPGMLTGMQDILFLQLAKDQFKAPFPGKELSDNYHNNDGPLVWESITANEDDIFTGRLGRAYLYTAYNSPAEQIVLLDATGHTRVFINGMPNEGDHYDYGHTLIPFVLKKGLNEFIYTYGRFGRVRSKLIIPRQPLQFSPRDMTLPSVIRGETGETWGGVRIVNASDVFREELTIVCKLETGEETRHQTGHIMPMAVRKLPFKIPPLSVPVQSDHLNASLILENKAGEVIDKMEITLNIADHNRHHERTFISNIDGSVQYYSVAPSTSEDPGQALILSVHGASVEATNQTRAYQQKDWGYIVAPTNRRPFGFNWEEWGRIDALEVLDQARRVFDTDTAKTYLTGHSMGGHGTWFLGATYPDRFAAIAPAAGYPDIIGYRRTGIDSHVNKNPHYPMIYRGALPGRTLELTKNYQQSGVYVLHGDADAVVPVEQARLMRGLLGEFHTNFTYYEYPGGSHWYGDHSMDWPPLFDFLRQNRIPPTQEVQRIDFITASPGVSATNYWLRIYQQLTSYQHSSVSAEYVNDTIIMETQNIALLSLLMPKLRPDKPPVIKIDGQILQPGTLSDFTMKLTKGLWEPSGPPNLSHKHPKRYGGLKLAFENQMVFVYATGGSDEENDWYKNKARFDAETFLYRGNGSIDVIPDSLFNPKLYAHRNVIIYGNTENNLAWPQLLDHSPVQVLSDGIIFGDTFLSGDRLGTYFIYPRSDSDTASVGVIAGTGIAGMKATWGNDYFSGITGFPDLLIFDVDWIRDSLEGVKISGFFGYDWSTEQGDFIVSP